MLDKRNILYIGEGVLRGFFLTLILFIIYAFVTAYVPIDGTLFSLCVVLITSLSIVYGTIYSTKKIKKRGWIIGMGVAIMYMLIIYIVAYISGRTPELNLNDFLRITLGIVVGILSGMLGINL